jgi:hypothetical protein
MKRSTMMTTIRVVGQGDGQVPVVFISRARRRLPVRDCGAGVAV